MENFDSLEEYINNYTKISTKLKIIQMELEALFNAVIVKPIEAEETTYGEYYCS